MPGTSNVKRRIVPQAVQDAEPGPGGEQPGPGGDLGYSVPPISVRPAKHPRDEAGRRMVADISNTYEVDYKEVRLWSGRTAQ
jgi:hypothetical protein